MGDDLSEAQPLARPIARRSLSGQRGVMVETVVDPPMTIAVDGAEHYPGAVLASLDGVRAALGDVGVAKAGVRIFGKAALSRFLRPDAAIGQIAARVMGTACRPVRALFFDKTPDANWALGWHQDRVICVRERVEVEGFGPWTVKGGMPHVAPPFVILARMVTLRVHLDDVPATNAPLLISPGSHKLGRVAVDQVEVVVWACGVRTCIASAGDVWAYSTSILHASERPAVPGHRRVLQIDYSRDNLPGGLMWAGV